MKKFLMLALLFDILLLPAGNLTLIRDGKAAAVIVTADHPHPVADYAARQLAEYFKKMSGAEISVIRESDFKGNLIPIYIGATSAAEKKGMGQNLFDREAWTIRSFPDALYITGGENASELFLQTNKKMSRRELVRYWNANVGFMRLARRGTFYGVCDFLDRVCGIRWLWPGDLGTVVPKKKTLQIVDNLKIDGKPAFLYREWWIRHLFRWWEKKDPELAKLDFSPEAKQAYTDAVRKFLLIYQEGDSEPQPAPADHIYTWYRELGKTHPDWFAMRDDGQRKPGEGSRGLIRLCVSNPELTKFIVEKKWDGGDWLGLGEADARGFCRCPVCMSWDQPQPGNFSSYSTTNRYIRYARNVRDLAMKKNPNVRISVLLYMDYLPPPAGKPDLSWMYGKFVPWGSGYCSYFPMGPKDLRALRDAWQGWANTGIRMHYRPNYLLSGYTLPALDISQSGEMFRFVARNGMAGFSFDSLRGFWATKGPMLYVHMRLGIDPAQKIEDILDDYYSAFGPAAADVRKYFDYWIKYTREKIPSGTGGVDFQRANEAAELYPPAVFEQPEKILENALAAAKKSPDTIYAERVLFLQHGLQHAKLCTEFSRLFGANRFTDARKKLNEIISFRRKHEMEFFSDLSAASETEANGYNGLGNFMRGKYEYFSDPELAFKKYKQTPDIDMQVLRPGKWGLTLPKKYKDGWALFKYDAGENNTFTSATLTFFASRAKNANRLEISFDNKKFEVVSSDIGKARIPLTERVKGKRRFYLRYSISRLPDADLNENLMALIKFRLDYKTKNPEMKNIRPKLEIGDGWLDLETQWFFKKDPQNRGLPQTEMNVKTISLKEWTPVAVPAKLETTRVGPYLGFGWYAAVFDVKKDWDGRSIDLLVGAVDEQAWVYFNGRYVGEHTVRSEKVDVGVLWKEPFIIRIPADLIRPGTKNLLQIKIHASRGASGIWKPVKIRPVDASAL